MHQLILHQPHATCAATGAQQHAELEEHSSTSSPLQEHSSRSSALEEQELCSRALRQARLCRCKKLRDGAVGGVYERCSAGHSAGLARLVFQHVFQDASSTTRLPRIRPRTRRNDNAIAYSLSLRLSLYSWHFLVLFHMIQTSFHILDASLICCV